MTGSVIADEHVRRVVVTELRSHGFDVEWVDTGSVRGRDGVTHLCRSADTGAIILSNDTDCGRHHGDYDHGGRILYDDQTRPDSAFIQGSARVERFVPESELSGQIVWLDSWID